ncbi:unnamed protein product [Blepharisma stoltei]|uniref:Uncharacterized protein n=1 Tax=Blepharisma stoltei TaxID=1481888 RepID=A0AAU9K2H2_9CILI|nr:unnamed protein product [Blepharisma stoltei]
MAEQLKINVPITNFTIDFRRNCRSASAIKRSETKRSLLNSSQKLNRSLHKFSRAISIDPRQFRSKSYNSTPPEPLRPECWRQPSAKIMASSNKKEQKETNLQSLLSSTTNLMRKYTCLGNKVSFTPLSNTMKKSNIKYIENLCNVTMKELEKRDKLKISIAQQLIRMNKIKENYNDNGSLREENCNILHSHFGRDSPMVFVSRKSQTRSTRNITRGNLNFQLKSKLRISGENEKFGELHQLDNL